MNSTPASTSTNDDGSRAWSGVSQLLDEFEEPALRIGAWMSLRNLLCDNAPLSVMRVYDGHWAVSPFQNMRGCNIPQILLCAHR